MCHKGHISDEWRTKDSCGIVPPLNAANGQLWPDQLISQRAPNQCFWSCGLSQVTHKYEWGPSQSSGLWFIKAGKDRTFAQPSTVYFLFVRFMYTHFSVKKSCFLHSIVVLWCNDFQPLCHTVCCETWSSPQQRITHVHLTSLKNNINLLQIICLCNSDRQIN